jgi:hypothetical protein
MAVGTNPAWHDHRYHGAGMPVTAPLFCQPSAWQAVSEVETFVRSKFSICSLHLAKGEERKTKST